MFICPLRFSTFNSASFVEYLALPQINKCGLTVVSWLAFGKLPENPIVTPNTTTQVVLPSAKNRYLQSVTVEPKPTTTTTTG